MDMKELAYYLFMEQQEQTEEVNEESNDGLECPQTTTTVKSDSKI